MLHITVMCNTLKVSSDLSRTLLTADDEKLLDQVLLLIEPATIIPRPVNAFLWSLVLAF